MVSKVYIKRFFILYSIMTAIFNFAHPITPAFFAKIKMPDYMFGMALAAMATSNFLFCPFWGRLSDNIGRVKIISISFLGYAVGQFCFMQSNSIVTVILSRLLSGVFAAGFSVVSMAYLADLTDEENRGKYTVYYVAFMSVCSSIGYLIGGFIGDFSIKATFLTQVIALVIGGLSFPIFLKDILVEDKNFDLKGLVSSVNPFMAFAEAKGIMDFPFFVFIITIFLATLATSDYESALNYYVARALAFPPSYNGLLKAAMGMIGLLANFTINQWIVRHSDSRKSIIVVLFMCSISLLFVSSASTVIMFIIINIIFYCFNTMYQPIQQSLITFSSRDKGVSNGILFGVFNSAKSIGMIGGSLFAGFIYTLDNKLPFICGGLVFLFTGILCFINYYQYKFLRKKRIINYDK